jgi:hypothetical protein
MTNIDVILQKLDQSLQVFRSAFTGTTKIMDVVPEPGKWSIRQIVIHNADSEYVAGMRFRLMAAEPGAQLSPFDQNKWAAHLGYTAQSAELGMEAFAFMRKLNLEMLRSLEPSAWSNVGVHMERGPTTLAEYVSFMAAHTEDHAAQIISIKKKFSQ